MWEPAEIGDVVGVLRGKFAGQQGMVERIEGNRLVILSSHGRLLNVAASRCENMDYIVFGHVDHGYPKGSKAFCG